MTVKQARYYQSFRYFIAMRAYDMAQRAINLLIRDFERQEKKAAPWMYD